MCSKFPSLSLSAPLSEVTNRREDTLFFSLAFELGYLLGTFYVKIVLLFGFEHHLFAQRDPPLEGIFLNYALRIVLRPLLTLLRHLSISILRPLPLRNHIVLVVAMPIDKLVFSSFPHIPYNYYKSAK